MDAKQSIIHSIDLIGGWNSIPTDPASLRIQITIYAQPSERILLLDSTCDKETVVNISDVRIISRGLRFAGSTEDGESPLKLLSAYPFSPPRHLNLSTVTPHDETGSQALLLESAYGRDRLSQNEDADENKSPHKLKHKKSLPQIPLPESDSSPSTVEIVLPPRPTSPGTWPDREHTVRTPSPPLSKTKALPVPKRLTPYPFEDKLPSGKTSPIIKKHVRKPVPLLERPPWRTGGAGDSTKVPLERGRQNRGNDDKGTLRKSSRSVDTCHEVSKAQLSREDANSPACRPKLSHSANHLSERSRILSASTVETTQIFNRAQDDGASIAQDSSPSTGSVVHTLRPNAIELPGIFSQTNRPVTPVTEYTAASDDEDDQSNRGFGGFANGRRRSFFASGQTDLPRVSYPDHEPVPRTFADPKVSLGQTCRFTDSHFSAYDPIFFINAVKGLWVCFDNIMHRQAVVVEVKADVHFTEHSDGSLQLSIPGLALALDREGTGGTCDLMVRAVDHSQGGPDVKVKMCSKDRLNVLRLEELPQGRLYTEFALDKPFALHLLRWEDNTYLQYDHFEFGWSHSVQPNEAGDGTLHTATCQINSTRLFWSNNVTFDLWLGGGPNVARGIEAFLATASRRVDLPKTKVKPWNEARIQLTCPTLDMTKPFFLVWETPAVPDGLQLQVDLAACDPYYIARARIWKGSEDASSDSDVDSQGKQAPSLPSPSPIEGYHFLHDSGGPPQPIPSKPFDGRAQVKVGTLPPFQEQDFSEGIAFDDGANLCVDPFVIMSHNGQHPDLSKPDEQEQIHPGESTTIGDDVLVKENRDTASQPNDKGSRGSLLDLFGPNQGSELARLKRRSRSPKKSPKKRSVGQRTKAFKLDEDLKVAVENDAAVEASSGQRTNAFNLDEELKLAVENAAAVEVHSLMPVGKADEEQQILDPLTLIVRYDKRVESQDIVELRFRITFGWLIRIWHTVRDFLSPALLLSGRIWVLVWMIWVTSCILAPDSVGKLSRETFCNTTEYVREVDVWSAANDLMPFRGPIAWHRVFGFDHKAEEPTMVSTEIELPANATDSSIQPVAHVTDTLVQPDLGVHLEPIEVDEAARTGATGTRTRDQIQGTKLRDWVDSLLGWQGSLEQRDFIVGSLSRPTGSHL